MRVRGRLEPFVIEGNARPGDPEAQLLAPGIKNDFFEMGMDVVEKRVGKLKIESDGRARVVVTGASRGYPGDYSVVKGKQVCGLEDAARVPGVKLCGAGIVLDDYGKWRASGGRLFYVVGEGENVIEARQRAYTAMACISVEGNNLHYRTDIGYRDVERLRKST